MKTMDDIIKLPRLQLERIGDDGGMGWAHLASSKKPYPAAVVFSWGGGWEHVSVSFKNRTPTWEEMAEIKQMFFYPNEVAVEYHPAQADYVNQMPYCLHIWRSLNQPMPTPPTWMIGLRKGQTYADVLKEAMTSEPQTMS